MRELNAIIRDALITQYQNGDVIASINFDFGDDGNGISRYRLYYNSVFSLDEAQRSVGGFVETLVNVLGAKEFSDIPGRSCRVKLNGKNVACISNILSDEWIDLVNIYEIIN